MSSKSTVPTSFVWLLIIMHFELFWLFRSQSLAITRKQWAGLKPSLYLWRGDWRNWSNRFWQAKKKSWPANWSWVVCWASLMTDEAEEGNTLDKWLCNRKVTDCLSFKVYFDLFIGLIELTLQWLPHFSPDEVRFTVCILQLLLGLSDVIVQPFFK